VIIYNLKDMQRKIFIAINLSDKTKKILSACQGKIKQKLNKAEVVEFIDWTERELLHITLSFLGRLYDSEVGLICSKIEKIIKSHETFDIILQKVSFGPKDKTPKFVWTEGEKSQELADLQKDIEGSLMESINIEDPKPFSPHITLGRIQKFQFNNINSEDLPDIELDLNISLAVESIEIMESVMTKYGIKYTILQSIKLK
jgi:RNA 2',3'-cyclic 3'-phosphodiesterase